MKKYNVRVIDGDTKQSGILNVKDDSFIIILSNDELIRLSYDEIIKYIYNQKNYTLTIKLSNNESIKLICEFDDFLQEKLDEILLSNKENASKNEIIKEISNEIYKVCVFSLGAQSNAELTFNESNVLIKDGTCIISIPVSSIIKLVLEENNNINIFCNNNLNFVIKCEEYQKLYNKLKKLKSVIKYKPDSTVEIKDNFGNTLKKKKSKIGIWIFIIIIVIVIFIVSCSGNDVSDASSTIRYDIKKGDSLLGYGTKYEIGEIISVYCDTQENDGNGRYIVKCDIEYYPKRNDYSIATDSKMKETIYASFMRNDDKHYSRLYTSYPTLEFKTTTCWGKEKSEGIYCGK